MITALGARYAADPTIQNALVTSVSRLTDCQTPAGAIPSYIDAAGRPNFRSYADGGLWWLIGSIELAPDPEAARKLLLWYEHQDVDNTGLLSMQEASDWQDLFCTRGKGLYLNCLYVLALRAAAKLFQALDAKECARCRERASQVADRLNEILWYRGDGDMLPHISHTFSTVDQLLQDSLGRPRWIPVKQQLIGEQYYLPYAGFRAVGEWFDSLGNLLAIVAGVADERQTQAILEFITRYQLDTWPICSLTPAVRPGDSDWREYYSSINQPHHYHNGGVWPFIGGFYVAALVKAGRYDAAARALQDLANLNLRGEFNEWHHGETGEPMGVQDQAWSAGMYLFAFECVRRGRAEII
jgi:glycogen debranching enzyme